MDTRIADCTEQQRLNEARETGAPWKKWGPYLSERQWGTLREDLLNFNWCASTVFEEDLATRNPKLMELIALFRKRHPEVLAHMAPTAEGAESDNGMFGGSSNWRGPVWMPVNVLVIRGLLNFYGFYGDDRAGLGASHQTGWTGLIAPLLDLFGRVDAEDALETSKERLQARMVREQVDGNPRRV